MTTQYIPIFKAKPGECKAIANSEKKQQRRMLPLFEISRIGNSVRDAKRFADSVDLVGAYLDEIAKNISEVRQGRDVMVDAFQWQPDATTKSGEHILPYIYNKLEANGVNVVPVVGYDRWESSTYRSALKGVKVSEEGYYCIRLDSHAIEDAADPEYFSEQIQTILHDLSIHAGHCAVLMDFGDITALSIETLIDQVDRVMQVIAPMGFKFFATAGCSLPPTIDGAVKKQNSEGKVLRKEMLLWQAACINYPKLKLIFGDYGVRGPNTADDIISPHTNGKIRHTIENNYYVVRGHSIQLGDKGAQMYKLAKTVIESPYYMGEDFSWGDAQIKSCSNGDFKGNSTIWIAIDTNHHLTWVVAEVEEFHSKMLGIFAKSDT